jgi:ankyrin repeat protein
MNNLSNTNLFKSIIDVGNYSEREKNFIKAIIDNDTATFNKLLQNNPRFVELRINGIVNAITWSQTNSSNLLSSILSNYKYPIHLAAMAGSIKIIDALLERSVFINTPASDGSTPLLLATHYNQYDTLIHLIAKGAEPKLSMGTGSTPLHQAAYKGWYKITEELIKYININTIDSAGETPLLTASFQEKNEIIKLLIDKGANIHITLPNGAGNLFYAAQNGFADIAELLLKQGINPNETRTTDLFSALHIAAYKGNLDVVKLLVEYGTNDNCKDDVGKTPMDWATANGHYQVAKYLAQLKHSTNTNKINTTATTSQPIQPLLSSLKTASPKIFKPTSDEEIAKEFYKKGQYKEGVEYFTKALANNKSKHSHLYCNIGHCYYGLKNYKEAIANYSKAIDLNSNQCSAYEWRAKSYRKLANSGVEPRQSAYIELAVEDENKVAQLKSNISKNLTI